MAYTAGSSKEIFWMENPGSSFWISWEQWSMTDRFRSPRKSIFRSPSSSRVVMVNWVTTDSSLFARGTYSSTGSAVITTPAA